MTKTAQNEKENLQNQARGLNFSLRLRSIKSTKNSFARLLQAYSKGEIEKEPFKILIYALSQYLAALKLLLESDVETRLREVEKRLEELL